MFVNEWISNVCNRNDFVVFLRSFPHCLIFFTSNREYFANQMYIFVSSCRNWPIKWVFYYRKCFGLRDHFFPSLHHTCLFNRYLFFFRHSSSVCVFFFCAMEKWPFRKNSIQHLAKWTAITTMDNPLPELSTVWLPIRHNNIVYFYRYVFTSIR